VKLEVVLDGEHRVVEVDLHRQTVRVGDHEWPIQVGAVGNGTVSFEILGERVEVRGDSVGKGPDSIVVNGELHTLLIESASGAPSKPPEASGKIRPTSTSGPSHPSGRADEGPGRAVFPPMPGKILEVRVKEGEAVVAGQVLLVLEAMKMRNEVTAPVAGAVTDLRVSTGANVGARDLLLRVVPG
jgi:glutaconyl-CoA/methylmalonyl-CoA decarboxylase subunit gamma